MNYPIGTVAICSTSDGSMPVWVKTSLGWSCIFPLEASAELVNPFIEDSNFDSDWVFHQPEHPGEWN
jgi:hypothetical protein